MERDMEKPRYVRVNTLFHTPDEIIKKFRNKGWNFIPLSNDYNEFLKVISTLDDSSFTKDFHIKELLVFPRNVQFYENELYHNGSILLQDKASCLPAFLLKPPPNSVVLDMCAAPGMKTTHLSALMKNKGKIYATELNPKRYKVLCNLVKHAGCSNVTTLNADALELGSDSGHHDRDFSWCKDVEYILVDPSCSGSGIVERVKIFLDEKNDPKRLKKLYRFQFKLLQHALINFPKVKKVVYSTCSIHPQENENVVESILKMLNEPQEEKDSAPLPKFRLAEPLKDTWPTRASQEFENGKYCIFADPHKDLTNGFFVAVFERIENDLESTKSEFEEVDEELSKKKKKKKKKKEHEIELEEDNLPTENNIKKKKKKVQESDLEEDNLPTENNIKKKEKEHDIHLREEKLESDEDINKRKKKKRKENFENELELGTTNDVKKKKKKKRKNEHDENFGKEVKCKKKKKHE